MACVILHQSVQGERIELKKRITLMVSVQGEPRSFAVSRWGGGGVTIPILRFDPQDIIIQAFVVFFRHFCRSEEVFVVHRRRGPEVAVF